MKKKHVNVIFTLKDYLLLVAAHSASFLTIHTVQMVRAIEYCTAFVFLLLMHNYTTHFVRCVPTPYMCNKVLKTLFFFSKPWNEAPALGIYFPGERL